MIARAENWQARGARPVRCDGDVAYVPLTLGYEAVVDASDVALVECYNWYALVKKRPDGSIYTVYAMRDEWLNGKRRKIYLHRAIVNPPSNTCVDHVDGDGLNNRRGNFAWRRWHKISTIDAFAPQASMA